MLYHLSQYLQDFNIPGAGMFTYISFRSLLALMLSLLIMMFVGKGFITYMKRKRHIEKARDAEIDPYGVMKKDTPSMGGIVIVLAVVVPALLLGRLDNIYMILLIVTILWFGALGFIDDYIKLKGNKDGMPPKFKILGQLLFVTTVPFVKNNNLDYYEAFSWIENGKVKRACGWILFILVTTFVITAISNGANLNDGMDGMCAGNSAIIGVALGILAYVSSNIHYAAYLNVMYLPGTQEVVVFLCGFIGALIGFLWYNTYPAKVFMGDTGSLSIGGVIAVTAVIIHKELLMPILCGIFLVESLSVMIQVSYAKRGNKRGIKQRVFKRTPIHDHFRVLQSQLLPDAKYLIKRPTTVLHENMITIRFWIITILLAAATIITLKIR